jgi:hypothetical protein
VNHRQRWVRTARLDSTEIRSEQFGFFCEVFLRHAFGISQLFKAQTKLALDKVVLIVFHDNLYQFCALIHTHTNSYISVFCKELHKRDDMKRLTRISLITYTIASLAACGGGGGSASSSTPTTYAVETAYSQAATTGISLNGTAVDGADTWTMALSASPAADETFEGATAKKSVNAITIKKNGVTVLSSGSENFFSINPFKTKGLKLNDGHYGVATVAGGAMSNAAIVGNSGSLGTVTIYASASKSSIAFTQEATWTLEEDTATTAYACTNTTAKDTTGVLITTTSGCYKIDAKGTIKGMKYTLALAGKTLVFR